MSKPLELTIFPKLSRPRTGAEIMPYREQWQREQALKQVKHLTEAELAAEYWAERESGRWAELMMAEWEAEDTRRNSVSEKWHYWRRSKRQSNMRALILHRFATLPHYDEVAA